MKRIFKLLISLAVAAALILTPVLTASAASNRNSAADISQKVFENYTYWVDSEKNTKKTVYSKPMYAVKKVISGTDFADMPFVSVTDVCTDSQHNLWLLDGDNSSIYVFSENYELTKTYHGLVSGGETVEFKGAKGIYAKNGKIYVADTENARVLVADTEGNVTGKLTLPESRLIPDGFVYKPIRIGIDSADTVYVASDGSYYGAIVYSKDNEFMGFFGANTVAADALTVLNTIFDRLFSNDIKKGSSLLALPYQMNDLVVNSNDFVFTASASSSSNATGGQIHLLNPGGKDILGKSDYEFADISGSIGKQGTVLSSVVGVDTDEDGFFYVLDYGYGRVYWYDSRCNILSVFGGSVGTGIQKGSGVYPAAIAVNGTDVIVGDNGSKCATVYSITEYGAMVRKAQLDTINNKFDTSLEDWTAISNQDSNSQLAYSGLAKAYFAAGDYDKAMEYAKLASDREVYADAFEETRGKKFEKAFGIVLALIILIVVGGIFLSRYKKKKGIVFIKSKKVITFKNSVFHPFASFGDVKEKGLGSIIIAAVMLLLFYIVTAVSDVACGYAYNFFDPATYNSFYILLRTIGLVGLFVICNWLVCVLMGGIGKLKEIFIVTCYSLVPVVFATLVKIILSHILVPDEFVFVTIFISICTAYTFFLIAVGIMKVHDYSFGKFLFTGLLTVGAMLIILFLIFLIFLLTQQVYGFVLTVISEIGSAL